MMISKIIKVLNLPYFYTVSYLYSAHVLLVFIVCFLFNDLLSFFPLIFRILLLYISLFFIWPFFSSCAAFKKPEENKGLPMKNANFTPIFIFLKFLFFILLHIISYSSIYTMNAQAVK